MNKEDLLNRIITPPDPAIHAAIRARWDSLSKPIDGLGDFETLICRIGAAQGTETPVADRRTAVIFCADNGVVEEGVSQCGSEVTAQVAARLGEGKSTVNVMAGKAGVKILPVDIGMCSQTDIAGVRNLKVSFGTRDFIKAPAMTEEETLLAIERGMELAGELADSGEKILAAGEMGIGNTTTATALLCGLLSLSPEDVCGRGAGLSDEKLERKKRVIAAGLKKYVTAGEMTEPERAFYLLSCLGGLDIAGMVGLYIGSAGRNLPVVCDGLISTVAALLAERMVPGVREYVIPSHAGREQGNLQALSALGLRPLIAGDMALGEGTGAVMLFPLIDIALALYREGGDFASAGIETYERYNK